MGILGKVNSFIWGVPTLILIIGVGAYFTYITGAAQLRLLPEALQSLRKKIKSKNDNTSFRALCTALAATVGTGNIAGVAGAIAIGGPGSIFWMWVCAILGMTIKFAEALLAVKYRKLDGNGEYRGGTMYMIAYGLKKRWHPMAYCYCILGACAAFGIGGATQINAVAIRAYEVFQPAGHYRAEVLSMVISVSLVILSSIVLLGGAKRIGTFSEIIVPTAAISYIVLSLGALALHYREIPSAMAQIVVGAFSPHAVTGGAVGSGFLVLRTGAARGVFTNEAGLGTAGIAHGTASVDYPAEQGLMGIVEVFLDTIVICTLTAFVILTSGVQIPYGMDTGASLTIDAMACSFGSWVSIPIAFFLMAFAFASILGWGFYGQRCIGYLLGTRAEKLYVLSLGIVTIASLAIETRNVWILSELVNGIMAIPNLIAVLLLKKDIVLETRRFIQVIHRRPASGKNLPIVHK